MVDSFSIIIPTLNEENFLPQLLNSISNQDFTGNLEVIIVDGKSEDRTLEVSKGYLPKLGNFQVFESSRGVSHQRNFGADKAQYSTLIFLDADTFLPKEFLSRVSVNLNSQEDFVCLPLIFPLKGNVLDYIFVAAAYKFFFIVSFFKPIVTGMCLITTKENHKKIGGFNEKVVFAEDIDYGLRSIKQGAKYHLYLSPHLFASTRRRHQINRFRLALLWIKWYFITARSGAITDNSKYQYPYGSHSTES